MLQIAYIVRRPRKVWEVSLFFLCPSTGAHLADGGALRFCDKASALAYCAEQGAAPHIVPSITHIA